MNLSRRALIIASVVLPLGGNFAAAETRELVYAGSGGGLAQVMDGLFDKPFTAATGIPLKALATADRVAAMKAMMAAGKPIWDVAELTSLDYAIASMEGWLEPIDWSVADPNNILPPEAKLVDAGVTATYSTVIAARADRLPEGKHMTSWADFWDVTGFPGPRALQDTPIENLEFALISDGVDKSEVYTLLATPEGVDRAFARLDQIKPAITAWWSAGAQPVQMLTDGEVNYTTAWNGRITQLRASGIPVEVSWNGGALKPSYTGIMKGTTMRKEAEQYMAFVLGDVARSAEFAKLISYPGMAPGIYDLIDPETGKQMPTHPDNMSQQFIVDPVFWAKNLEPLQERWQEWMLE